MNDISFRELLLKKEKLTPKQKKAFDHMLSNADDSCYTTIRQVAKQVGITEVSILRMSRALGFEGFADLRDYFRAHIHEIRSYDAPIPNTMRKESDGSMQRQQIMLLENMINYERSNLEYLYSSLSSDQLFKCARAILDAKNIALFGHTSSKVLADFFTIRLNYLQRNAASIMLDEGHYMKSMLARIGENDMIILFSYSPYYQPVCNVVRYAEHKQATIITITDSANSPAINNNGFNFICNTSTRFFFNSQTATISLINLITSTIALEMGERLDLIQQEEHMVSRFLNLDVDGASTRLTRYDYTE